MFTSFVEFTTYVVLVVIVAAAVACLYAALTLFNGDEDENNL